MRRINIKEDMIKFFQNQPARFDRVVMRTRINIYTSLSLGRQCLQDMFKYFQNQKHLDLTEVRIITLGGKMNHWQKTQYLLEYLLEKHVLVLSKKKSNQILTKGSILHWLWSWHLSPSSIPESPTPPPKTLSEIFEIFFEIWIILKMMILSMSCLSEVPEGGFRFD